MHSLRERQLSVGLSLAKSLAVLFCSTVVYTYTGSHRRTVQSRDPQRGYMPPQERPSPSAAKGVSWCNWWLPGWRALPTAQVERHAGSRGKKGERDCIGMVQTGSTQLNRTGISWTGYGRPSCAEDQGADSCSLRRAEESQRDCQRQVSSEAICPKTRWRRAATRFNHCHQAGRRRQKASKPLHLEGALSRKGGAQEAWEIQEGR